MNKKIALTDIIAFLGNEIKAVYGHTTGIEVRYLKDPLNVDKFTLDWINPLRSDQQQIAETSKAKAILAGQGITYSEVLKEQGKVILLVENPKLAVAKVGNRFLVENFKLGIHPTAVIHPEAEIGKNIYIGSGVNLGKCIIGNNVYIHPNVVLYDNVILGDNIHIYSNASVGVEGLGCEREQDGRLVKFPHLGGVIIENDVEIGAACIIARGALSDTIIGKGSKINVGSFIAHNTILGCNVWISPKVNIAGSVKVGDNVTIFSGAILREQRKIGKGAVIGMGAVVTKNVPAGEKWIGNPARKMV